MSEQLEGIKAIIFDLGNVIIDLHYDRAANRLADLSGLEGPELNQLLVSSDVLKVFEVGGMSESEFRQEVCDLLKIKLVDDDFDQIWNSLLGEISKARLDKLGELKNSFKTFVLSNTNAIHLRSFDDTLLKAHGFEGIHKLVHKAYYSHTMKMRKPNSDIYEFVLSENKLVPSEVLFIDDRKDNIEAARELGIHTYWNKNMDDWIDMFARELNWQLSKDYFADRRKKTRIVTSEIIGWKNEGRK